MTGNGRPILLATSRPEWAAEFTDIARRIRNAVGDAALRVDHIGSTAVPGLAAKDVIDIQITVADLDAAANVTQPLSAAGFRTRVNVDTDLFHGLPAGSPALRKRYMREPEGERRVHIHIRERGRFNQRFALLFRDYLRASDMARDAYALAKQRAAEVFPNDIDGYLRLKEPVFHLVYHAADLWATSTGWSVDGRTP